MQTVSYKIGDYNQRNLTDAASMYKQTISAQGHNLGLFRKDPQSTMNLRGTNIKLGNENRVDYTSEAKEKFVPQANENGYIGNNREASKHLRTHNFTLQETNKSERPNYFETVKNIDFNYKGDPR